jgi:hypothetical protein
MPDVTPELAKGGINLAVTLVALGAGWLVGQRLTYQWNLRQKRRESDLAAAQDLQRLYGDFFAVWKQWNPAAGGADEAYRRDLLRRAADGEGLLERVLVKLATERRLSASDRESLGQFRHAYKQLRYAIDKDKKLGWHFDDHPEYLAFKRLAAAVTLIVHREPGRAEVGPEEAFAALREMTSNRHSKTWKGEPPAGGAEPQT